MTITIEHASRRYFQMATIERQIIEKQSEIAACADHMKELKKDYDGLINGLRAAARDEGDLPLFDGPGFLLEDDAPPAPADDADTPTTRLEFPGDGAPA